MTKTTTARPKAGADSSKNNRYQQTMADKKDVQFEEVQAADETQQVINRARGFWEKFSRPIIFGGGALILLLGGYYAYLKAYQQPRENKAADAIWHAQRYFEMDSLNLALNGDGQHAGFEKVAANYGGTKAGNLARFYAGVTALKLGDFNKAVKHLSDFKTDAREVQTVAYARLADAYSELQKYDDAIRAYEKAGRYYPEHESLSAENLFRAGLLSETQGKEAQAITYYKEIKEKYGRTDRGYQIDKYLARLGVTD